LRAEADAEAERRRVEAEAAGEQRLAEAWTQAEEIAEQARLAGERAAARAARRRRAAASRRARELQLDAERSLLDGLRASSRAAARALRTEPGYPQLLERLSRAARSQLGPEAELEIDPPQAGGVLARAGSISVDYSLPALVDRAIEMLGGEVERLWR
jgi:vacuolar-type H+-ATPase subunit E/Vma4